MHQTHISEEEMFREARRSKLSNSKDNIYKIIKKYSLSESDKKITCCVLKKNL